MNEPLEMTLQERMAVLSFASKSLELLETKNIPPKEQMDLVQWLALGRETHKVLARLDADWPAMLPLPHDGKDWAHRIEEEV